MLADFDFSRAKLSGPIRCKIATNVAMQVEEKGFIQWTSSENAIFKVLQHSQDMLGQQRRELRVGKNPARRFYEARGVRRLCRVFSHSKSTGSPSNAMLAATWRGTSAQRRALRSAGFSFRQSAIFFCQVMVAIYTSHRASQRFTFSCALSPRLSGAGRSTG